MTEITTEVTRVPLIVGKTYSMCACTLPEQHTNPKQDKGETSMQVPVSWYLGWWEKQNTEYFDNIYTKLPK